MDSTIILLLVLPLPVLWLIAYIILYPTVVAAQKVRGPFRFQLLDFVSLILQIQLVLAPIMAWTSGEEVTFQRNLFLAVGCGSTVAMWLAAVSFLSRAGIQQGLRRAIFILVYLPGTLAVLIGGPTLLGRWLMIPEQRPPWAQPPEQLAAGIIGVLVLTIAVGFALRKLGEWLVR